MRRRIFLKGTAAVAGGAIASILGVDHRVADAQETSPTVVDAELSVLDSGCGDGSQRATVRADATTDRVTVDGVAAAPSACYTAELADATYDDEADALNLTVRSVEREDVDVCAQCLTAIEYRAVVTFDGELPDLAVVRHDDETVTETALDASTANWRQSAFDAANTAVDPAGRGPREEPTIRWIREGVGSAPAVVDASTGDDDAGGSDGGLTAYVGARGGGIRALNVETGSERWSFDAVGPLAGTPAVVGGSAYAGSTDGQIAAVDTTSGNPAWTRSVDSGVAAGPTVTIDSETGEEASPAPGAVYVATRGSGDGGRVHAIDPADGRIRWTQDAGGSVGVSPAATDERVYVARSDGTLLALSPEDGQRQWELTVGDATSHVSAPAVRDGTAYLAARIANTDGPGGRVFAVDAASGESDWTVELGASAVPRSLAVADGTVVAGAAVYGDVALVDETDGREASGATTDDGTDGNESVDGTDGSTETVTKTNSTEEESRQDDASDGSSGVEGRIYALDAGDGEERWRRTANVDVTAGTTVAGETVYIPLNGGISALAVDDGTERWTASFPARVTAPPTPAVGRLYVAVDGDRLVALDTDGSGDGAVTR